VSEKLRVAIVDDTPDMRLLVRLSLELDPHIDVVAEAEDGRGAIDVAQSHQPDVMLLDLAMPVMDGMQALPQVVRASPTTAVLVLSGFAASAMAEDAVSAGAKGYLQKGIGAEDLCERVWQASGRDRPEQPLEDVFALTPETAPTASSPADGVRDVAARAAEQAPGGLVVLGTPPGEPAAGWLLLYLNPEARTLLDVPDDGVGERVGDLVPSLAPVLDSVLGSATEGRVQTGTGALRVRARRDGDEVVVTLARAADDGTSQEEVERLRAALARTAHELRSPVTVLVGISEAAQAAGDRLPEDRRQELRGALHRQAEILKRLTSDLETATHAQRGSLAVELEPVDVLEVVRSCLHAADAPFEVYADQGVRALADPSRLTQMVTNLVSNARKYAEPPYELHVSRGDGHVHLTVADRGAGVPEHFRPLLFEEFTRADHDSRGTGLGLFVVRSLAVAQGGAVDYRPRHGGGSVFTVRLRAV
jgi:signal transduction histidine kinase/DNA-binding NarL/FixJ family response regulator